MVTTQYNTEKSITDRIDLLVAKAFLLEDEIKTFIDSKGEKLVEKGDTTVVANCRCEPLFNDKSNFIEKVDNAWEAFFDRDNSEDGTAYRKYF